MSNKITKNTNLTSDNSTFLRSVSKETKEHFDSLLKKALHKNDKLKKGLNPQNRNNKLQKSVSCETKKNDEIVDNTSPVKQNFILEKFLSDAVNSKKDKNSNSDQTTKIPVPLPRKTKTKDVQKSPVSEQGTYSISSPVLQNADFLKDFDGLSTCSKNTYNITTPQVINNTKDEDTVSNTSKGTYNIYKSDKQNTKSSSSDNLSDGESEKQIGDILFHHNTPKSNSVVKIVNKTKKKESTSSENSPKIHYEDETAKTIATKKSEHSSDEEQLIKTTQLDEKTSEQGELNDIYVRKESEDGTKVKNKVSNSKKSKKLVLTYQDLIGIVVYKTDKLMLNSFIHHPCVKIHVVDSETGEYLRKSKELGGKDNSTQKIKHIFPQITKSYELQRNRSLIPNWEELIIFEEDFDYFLGNKESVIIFFEILDFLSFSDASSNYSKEGSNSGWHKVAWAFIKLVSKTGQLNIEQKIRLQLYKPKKSISHKTSTECFLFDWWSKGALTKYPSTLHICIKRIKSNSLKETRHSDAVIKSEINLDIIEKDNDEEEENLKQGEAEKDESVLKWSRVANQSCKVPNNVSVKLKTAKKGCFGVKFSNNGLLVACGVADMEKNPIIVYSVLTKKEHCKMAGHQGIVYNLYWSSDDKYLISSSADCTACLWNVHKKQFYPKQVLPHPAFVYCAILDENLHQIITGCYDQVIRIWKSANLESEFQLFQELDGHTAYITSLSFGEDKNVLFSSDSSGIITEWRFDSKKKEWNLKRTLQLKELQRTVINNIKLHPGGKRMVIFCRDSIHRMVDLNVGCIVQWYRGILNYRIHTNGSISPCGNLVFAPSEDGSIFFWNTDTGTLLSTFNPFSKITKDTIVINYIDYHPFDHLVVISHYGSPVPVLFCNYNARNEQRANACAAILQNLNMQREMCNKNNTKTKSKKVTQTSSNVSFDVIMNKIDNLLVTPNGN